MPQASKPKKIAILGGGMAGLAAAFELTRQPGWKQQYEITLYQQGWRLGGKGASGRNRDEGQGLRSEEHGFHVFMGFYEQALGMLGQCYKELGRRPGAPFATVEQAFEAHDDIHFLEDVKGEQRIWPLKFKPRKKPLGQDFASRLKGLDSKWNDLLSGARQESDPERLTRLLLERMGPSLGMPGPDEDGAGLIQKHVSNILRPDPLTHGLPRDGSLPLVAYALLTRARAESPDKAVSLRTSLTETLERAREEQWEKARPRFTQDDEGRRNAILINLGITIAFGLAREGLQEPDADLSPLDAWDFRAWLREHGARPEACESPIVQAGYNLTFSSPGKLAAGAALQGLLRMLDYTEHLYFKMKAGMGEVVIAPLYLALEKRGVRFEFFHSVDSLRLSEDRQRVAAIDVTRQVALAGTEYNPLIDVDGLPCWPAAPLYEQLQDADELKKAGYDFEAPQGEWRQWKKHAESRTLELGRDFDVAVLSISVGALTPLCTELLEHSPRLRQMVTSATTTATQTSQFWFSRSLEDDARWKRKGGVLACCPAPFDTWADSSQVLATEKWDPAHRPRSLVYLCGPLEEVRSEDGPVDKPVSSLSHVSSLRPKGEVKTTARDWLAKFRPTVWPENANPTIVLREATKPDTSTDGEEPPAPPMPPDVMAEYHRASTHPSDRYVLTPPGSTANRLGADESGYDNLLLAGDWVRTPLNTGCVEAAVMAGQQAANALQRKLRLPELRTVLRQPAPLPRRRLPTYVERGGLATWRGPFRQGRTRLHSFFLECDYDKLKQLCDVYFNDLQDVAEYRPLGGFAVLQCARIDESVSLDPEFNRWGSMKEREIGITIPVVGGKMVDGEFQADRLLLFAPHLFVDTGVAMAVGREIYGFAKQMGRVSMPEDWGQPANFSVQTQVVSQLGQRADMREVLSIRRHGDKPLERPTGNDRFDNDTDAFSEIVEKLVPLVRVENLAAALRKPQALLFLKQFRDAEQTSNACYQAIVEAPFVFSHFESGGLLPRDFTLRFQSHHSHDLAQELGTPPEAEPLMATVLDLDFDLKDGRVIWSWSADA
ncbi:NAD(P)-binding protein [Archangium violaceum]|uniref:NAD(P)-binding protein n=1 Tax=Archangium violaceum TaxID=83451 RepID=UPI0019513892|nr:NAD(P)-binding protein [Archangium violaceum]QRN97849.1 NAD(P)-binding protein [Archangium violaceum]